MNSLVSLIESGRSLRFHLDLIDCFFRLVELALNVNDDLLQLLFGLAVLVFVQLFESGLRLLLQLLELFDLFLQFCNVVFL